MDKEGILQLMRSEEYLFEQQAAVHFEDQDSWLWYQDGLELITEIIDRVPLEVQP